MDTWALMDPWAFGPWALGTLDPPGNPGGAKWVSACRGGGGAGQARQMHASGVRLAQGGRRGCPTPMQDNLQNLDKRQIPGAGGAHAALGGPRAREKSNFSIFRVKPNFFGTPGHGEIPGISKNKYVFFQHLLKFFI